MKITTKRGFSLVEVNMAVFVMAIGILSMVALYPLGLRQSSQGRDDMMEATFADDLLNQAVAIASSRSVKWSDWNDDSKNPLVPYRHSRDKTLNFRNQDNFDELPNFIKRAMKKPSLVTGSGGKSGIRHFRIACMRPPAHSGRIMGIMVQSTTEDVSDANAYSNHPIYYAEAYFQGKPE